MFKTIEEIQEDIQRGIFAKSIKILEVDEQGKVIKLTSIPSWAGDFKK